MILFRVKFLFADVSRPLAASRRSSLGLSGRASKQSCFQHRTGRTSRICRRKSRTAYKLYTLGMSFLPAPCIFLFFFRLFSAEKRCMMLDIVYFDCLSKSGFELVRHISRFFGVIATHTLLGQGQEAQAPRQADK